MIAEKSIEEVKEKADLLEVIGKFVTLKKKGSSYSGCCPFHEERTPSFTVTPAKGIYKCFGCGAGGIGAIKFVMDKEKLSWIESIRWVAKELNITLEETEDDPDRKEQQLKQADYAKINKAVSKRYQEHFQALVFNPENPVVTEIFDKRQLTADTAILFELGYAPDEWKFITPVMIERGLYDAGMELGLIKTKEGNTWDAYRNRIIFPIHNERGEIVGFGGRTMSDDKDTAKYLNSSDSILYKKENVLYGIYQAAAAIRKMGFVCIVEGYFDVTGFYQAGMQNTVAPCGTALTEGHAKLLKKYTNHVVLIGDGDGAGMKANLKAVDILLKHNFKVEICELPKGEDPDSFARTFQFVEEETND